MGNRASPLDLEGLIQLIDPIFHRLFGNLERSGDPRIREALGDQVEDLLLARRQPRQEPSRMHLHTGHELRIENNKLTRRAMNRSH